MQRCSGCMPQYNDHIACLPLLSFRLLFSPQVCCGVQGQGAEAHTGTGLPAAAHSHTQGTAAIAQMSGARSDSDSRLCQQGSAALVQPCTCFVILPEYDCDWAMAVECIVEKNPILRHRSCRVWLVCGKQEPAAAQCKPTTLQFLTTPIFLTSPSKAKP